jgi:hypothetical protein
MNIYIDTEFQEYATDRYTLISLAAVRDDGAEFYAEADWWNAATASPWLQQNVVPHLRGPRMSKDAMREAFRAFCGPHPEWWGYYCSHDWFLICDVMGGFMGLPPTWPQWINDVQTIRTVRGTLRIPNPPQDKASEHDALADARWTRTMYRTFVALPQQPIVGNVRL